MTLRESTCSLRPQLLLGPAALPSVVTPLVRLPADPSLSPGAHAPCPGRADTVSGPDRSPHCVRLARVRQSWGTLCPSATTRTARHPLRPHLDFHATCSRPTRGFTPLPASRAARETRGSFFVDAATNRSTPSLAGLVRLDRVNRDPSPEIRRLEYVRSTGAIGTDGMPVGRPLDLRPRVPRAAAGRAREPLRL